MELEIEIIFKFEVMLNRNAIYELWATTESITNNIDKLDIFINGKTLKVFIIRGRNIFEKLKNFKKKIRGSFKTDNIRNLVHTPDNTEATRRELKILIKNKIS